MPLTDPHNRLKLSYKAIDDTHMRIILKGQLSEAFDHTEIDQPKGVSSVTFDLEGIFYISSVGIREWVLLLNKWSKKFKLFFERCSISFIDQINMVPDCLGEAQMISFFAPYYCECRKTETMSLLDVRLHHGSLIKQKAPRLKCPDPDPKCTKGLEFDALEECYFAFVSTSKSTKDQSIKDSS